MPLKEVKGETVGLNIGNEEEFMPVSVIKVNMSVLAFKRKEDIMEPSDGQAPSHLHTSTPDPQSSLILSPHSKE